MYSLHAYLIYRSAVRSTFQIEEGEWQRSVFHFVTVTPFSTSNRLPSLIKEQVILSSVRQWSGGLKKPKPASSSLTLCLHLIQIENSGSPFCISYLSMKGFRMVVPSKKNMRTEKPIIANPSSMARSSPALDGSFLCTYGKSPSSWPLCLLLPEAEKAVLWRK